MQQRTCTIDGCYKRHEARGLCPMHYYRLRKFGSATAPIPPRKPRTRKPPVDPWCKIDQAPGPDECWPWIGRVDQQGYGKFKLDGRDVFAPRWVLGQSLGRPLGAGEVTRHTCDNPPCCNPAHLLPGTPADNSRDMVERGRGRAPGLPGESNPAARMTAVQVMELRDAYANGETQVRLASRFGITQSVVSKIVRRELWAHVSAAA